MDVAGVFAFITLTTFRGWKAHTSMAMINYIKCMITAVHNRI